MKKCNCCQKNKELKEFNKNKRESDGLQKSCRECTKTQQNKSYHKNPKKYQEKIKEYLLGVKQWLIEFKKKKTCVKCGEKRWYVLDFHHKDSSKKLYNIGDGSRRSKGMIEKEIKKCVLLCRNCHSEFHYLEREEGITLKQYLK